MFNEGTIVVIEKLYGLLFKSNISPNLIIWSFFFFNVDSGSDGDGDYVLGVWLSVPGDDHGPDVVLFTGESGLKHTI